MRVGSRVGIRLIHITHTTGFTTIATHYRIQTAWADRPPEGIQIGYLRCATCGDMVGFRLHSEAGTTARKRRWLVFALVAAVVCAAVSVLTIHYGFWAAEHTETAYLGMSLLMVGPGLASWVSIFILLAEDGVTPLRRRNGQHHFKPLSALVAWSNPPRTDWPVNAEIVFHDSDPLDPSA
ncbi:hypothetical protein [Streptomyces tendae]|uniref:hypothetical protein n=1 Tax=Streptomyces tendae TaxID=1932 RepID=UPI00368583BF